MDYVTPKELMNEVVLAGERKVALSVRDLLLRGILAGAFLGFATSLALTVNAQGVPPIVGAILFPAGFVILVLLGLELATGNFAILPAALLSGKISLGGLLRNWSWVYLGNLIGSLLYALLFYWSLTSFGAKSGGAVGDLLKAAAQNKTLGYAALGHAGWATALVKAILCNWMVTVGALLALISRSTTGKIVAMWLPILTFFAQGFEHSIVNMFVIPSGMLFGAPVSLGKWLLWNQLPVTLGNILSGALLTGLAMYVTYGEKRIAPREVATPAPGPASSAVELAPGLTR